MDKTKLRLIATACGIAATFASAAQSAPVAVTVFADRFIVASRAHKDLDALERDVATLRPSTVTIFACGGASSLSVKAVVHRLRHLPVGIIPRLPEEVPCSRPVLMGAGLTGQDGAAGIDQDAVEVYWAGIMP